MTTRTGFSVGPIGRTLRCWFDAASESAPTPDEARRIDWLRIVPFLAIHALCVGVIWVGWSPFAVGVAAALYAIRMLAVTGFYHRYFSHRAFRTSRAAQFAFAALGATAAQRGPLWWAAHHRHHHAHSDEAPDSHSPRQHGLLWSHMGWFLARANYRTRIEAVPDLARYPELRFLDRYDAVVPLLFAVSLYVTGEWLASAAPALGTSGLQLLVWGFAVSTVVLYQVTFSINSLAHRLGTRRYATGDDSRNNLWLALLTFGEGWHNNHHAHPTSARHGLTWYEFDINWIGIRALQRLGIARDVRVARIAEPVYA
ncbi:MAG: acyl-CoA desaturase, partial [Candidatus Binataceae bacterium]